MHIVTMFWRDFRSRLRDRSALVVAIVVPAALTTVLSFLAAGPSTEGVPVGVVGSPTPVGSALAEGPLASLADDGTLDVTTYPDQAALRAAVADGDVDGGLAVSADGSRVTVLTDPGSIVAAAILEAISRSTALTVDGVTQAVAADRVLGGSASPDALADAVIDSPAPGRIADGGEGADALDTRTQVAAGMATFFLFFTVQFGVLGLLEEKRQGTLARILAAPVPPWQLLVSKALVSLALGLASMTFLIGFSAVLLDAHWGAPLGVAMLVGGGVLAAVATVTLVVGVARSPEQAGALQSGVALVLGILGGAFFSMARAGGIAAVATELTPHYWFNEGLVRLTGGQSWTAALGPLGALLTFTVVVGAPGLVLARRTVRS